MADILKFKAEYQADITKNFEGYSVKVLSPMYVGDSMAEADFVWYGGFQRADMDKIMSWFRSTNWAQQFSANMTCSTSSLWMAP